MHFHLDKHLFVVCVSTHDGEFLQSGHPQFLVFIFASNPKSSTAYQLVMTFEHDTFGTVPVDDVKTEKQRLWLELE